MRAYVHIGATKTGSTTLQTFFDKNRAGLSAQGVRYWYTDTPTGSSISLANAALTGIGRKLGRARVGARAGKPTAEEGRERLDAYRAELAEIAATATESALLVSSEHVSVRQRDAESIAAIDALFRESFDAVDYIYYIRNQHDLALSRYSQRVKGGMGVPLDVMLDRSMKSLDHLPFVETWIDTIGAERFHLRLMDPTALVNGDLCDDFCHVIGVDPAPLAKLERRNESMSAAAIELARRINQRMPTVTAPGKINTARENLIRRIGNAAAGQERLALTPEQADRITQAVEAGNEALRARFFPDRETLFRPSSAVRPAAEAQASDSQVLDLAVRLLGDVAGARDEVAKAEEPAARKSRRERPGPRAAGKKMKKNKSRGSV